MNLSNGNLQHNLIITFQLMNYFKKELRRIDCAGLKNATAVLSI
jgi:hypothetical protein